MTKTTEAAVQFRTIQERQARVRIASRQYVNGEIGERELRRIQAANSTDYRSGITALAESKEVVERN